MTKEAFNNNNNNKKSFHQQNEILYNEETSQTYIWSTVLLGGETWTHRKTALIYLERFEMWWWGVMGKIRADRVEKEVLGRVKEERNMLQKINEEMLSGLVNSCLGTAYITRYWKKNIRGGKWWKRRKQLLDGVVENLR
jgi:hypothetical protein